MNGFQGIGSHKKVGAGINKSEIYRAGQRLTRSSG